MCFGLNLFDLHLATCGTPATDDMTLADENLPTATQTNHVDDSLPPAQGGNATQKGTNAAMDEEVGKDYSAALEICTQDKHNDFESMLLKDGPSGEDNAIDLIFKLRQDENKQSKSRPF